MSYTVQDALGLSRAVLQFEVGIEDCDVSNSPYYMAVWSEIRYGGVDSLQQLVELMGSDVVNDNSVQVSYAVRVLRFLVLFADSPICFIADCATSAALGREICGRSAQRSGETSAAQPGAGHHSVRNLEAQFG